MGYVVTFELHLQVGAPPANMMILDQEVQAAILTPSNNATELNAEDELKKIGISEVYSVKPLRSLAGESFIL